MIEKNVFVDDLGIRLGNILYFLAYCFHTLGCDDIKVYTINKRFYTQRRLFKFEVILGEPENCDLKFSDTTFDEILNADNCDFKKLQENLNKEYIDSFRYRFDTSNLCVINLRFGDYLKKPNIDTYKTVKPRWLKKMIEKYDVVGKYNIVLVSDSGQMAREMGKYVGIDAPVVSNDALLCFNLLLKAKFIIGSCSTFSFAGCMLNYNGANMAVEYPYYQENNPYGWSPEKDSSIYNDGRIIKELYKDDEPIFAVCTIIKDEHKILDEWIQHNISLGFSKIYLFEDIGSLGHEEICSKYKEVILQRIENTNYERYRGIWYGSWRQTAMMNMFLTEYRVCADWVAFIDVDEFIVFDEGYNLSKLTSEYKKENGIYLYWKNYGASGYIEAQSGKTTDIYVKEGRITKFDTTWAHKSLVNLTKYVELNMPSPHTINKGVNTFGIHTNGIICYGKCHINHYVTKSFEDYVEQIFLRGDVSPSHRKFDFFFEINDDLKPRKEELIDKLLNIGNKIPKIIHYCWFGGGELSDLQNKCIESWKKYAPDYEIRRWDENNYDIHKNQITETLYNNGMYAFLSDYARSDIMYQYGGIYLDTDVELVKPIDELVDNGPFFGYGHTSKKIANGIGYMMPPGNFIDKFCMLWIGRQELDKIFSVNNYIDSMFGLFGVSYSGKIQKFHGISLYPEEYLDPKDYETDIIELTENTVAIHHGTHLW